MKAKVWDIKNNCPALVAEKEMNIGHIYAISACQDSPYVFAAGGASPNNHLYVWDARDNANVVETFKDRFNINVPDGNEKMDDGTMAPSSSSPFQFKQKKRTDAPTSAPSTSAGPSQSSQQSVKSMTKKKKKKKNPVQKS